MKKFIESLKKEIKEILDCCKQPLWKLRYFFYGWALGGVIGTAYFYKIGEIDEYGVLLRITAAIILFLLPLAYGEKNEVGSG
ncbi:hypothetical protein ACW4EZ_30200 (plasmid) [Bacillus toyonensis]|uniref:hypothetical protein n=1 Tax=Bacillus TaxID=1386 RepID=UPI000BEBB918|nr:MULTISPECIES: hypothetical protein [Bacillus]QPW51984.1 hypothetical protein G9298_30670 [Bacillus thuringiensis]AXK21614.1 hypothetical protein DPQ31_29595 [Bacillus sp. COPE52]MED3396432.1 hypothetical protein [Bacillus wiedmannii]PED94976.1 hypothetical protein CON90_10650 [Bacillus toyonensis]PEL58667.1 hypothetical protein CN633_15735 [Bacillus toyonensis]